MRAPPGAHRGTTPSESTPGVGSRLGHSKAAQAEGDGTSQVEHSKDHVLPRTIPELGFHLGNRVRTAPSLRPARLASKTGHVYGLNGRDRKVAVWLGGYLPDGNLSILWFQPGEVRAAEAVTTAPEARRSLPRGRPGARRPRVAA